MKNKLILCLCLIILSTCSLGYAEVRILSSPTKAETTLTGKTMSGTTALPSGIWDSAGNVSIGTTTTPSATLVVVGTFKVGTLIPANQGLVSTGGTVTTVGADTVITYDANGSFTPPVGVTNVRVLVVAGGGAAGSTYSGGGGGGEVIESTGETVVPGTSYTITVGTGANTTVDNDAAQAGLNGSNSAFGSIILAKGGGGGGGGADNTGNVAPLSGGSGGGGGGFADDAQAYGALAGTAGTLGTNGVSYRSAGAAGAGVASPGVKRGGGGGGAGGGAPDENGGAGYTTTITGTSATFGGGGGGGAQGTTAGSGGTGGGGNGVADNHGSPGTANTGGGGGGGGQAWAGSGNGGAGGSGKVVVRFTTRIETYLTADSSGKIGIGTSTPATAVHVIGTMTASQGIILGDGTSLTTTKYPYIQLSDSTSQAPGTTTPVQVTLDTVGEQQTFSYSPSSGNITIPESGVYYIVAAGQIGEVTNSNVNVDMWMRKNTTNIANSNVRNFLTEAADTKVLISQAVIRLVAGDIIKIYMSVDAVGASAGLRVTNPAGEPRIPSIIFTMYKIGS